MYHISGVVTCKVCEKTYSKSGSHSSCYKRYCGICSEIFETTEMQIKHSKTEHPKNFCSKCNECNLNLSAHKANYCKKDY